MVKALIDPSSITVNVTLVNVASVTVPAMVTGVMILFGDHNRIDGVALPDATGGWESITYTVRVAVLVLPAASVARYVSV